MTFRSHRRAWILASLTAANVAACAAYESNGAAYGGGDPGTGGYGGGNNGGNGGVIDYDASTGSSATGDYAELCGRPTCDLTASAAGETCQGNPGTGGGGGGGGSANGGAGSSPDGGAGGAGVGSGSVGVGGGTGGAEVGSGSVGAGGADVGSGSVGAGGSNSGAGGGSGGDGGAPSGAGGAGGYTPPITTVECKLRVTADGLVERACVSSGDYAELSPCNAASDCGPGLGCVLSADQGTGVCRWYCCGDVEACPSQTYCAPQPMTEAADPNVQIPVCVEAEGCVLLEENQCDDGLVCTVVRADGTTACVAPGPGKQGESCPCAPGYACSKLVDECRKICHTDPDKAPLECDSGFKCQGKSTLPDGFGLCVSTSDL